jgi:serine/threonine protein kinase
LLGNGSGGTVRLFKTNVHPTPSSPHPIPKTYAVKEFRKRGTKETERAYLKRLTAEYCIASTLRHPNVIETLDMIFDGGHVYTVMEYCPHDLYWLMTSPKHPTPTRATLKCYFVQFCRAVQYMHQCGIAHRDLKLENCVISMDGVLKVIDFGSAEVVRTPWESKNHLSKGVRGSDPYIAPEVWTLGEFDARASDVWSSGIVAICMMYRHFPWTVAKTNDRGYAFWQKSIVEMDKASVDFADVKAWLVGEDALDDAWWLIVRNMLEVNVGVRWKIDQVVETEWVKQVQACEPGVKGGKCDHAWCADDI